MLVSRRASEGQHKGIPASKSVSSRVQLKSLYAKACSMGNKYGLQGHDLTGISEVPPTGKKETQPPFLERYRRMTLGTTGQSVST